MIKKQKHFLPTVGAGSSVAGPDPAEFRPFLSDTVPDLLFLIWSFITTVLVYEKNQSTLQIA